MESLKTTSYFLKKVNERLLLQFPHVKEPREKIFVRVFI